MNFKMEQYLSAWDKIVKLMLRSSSSLPACEIRKKNCSIWNTLCKGAGMYEKCKVNFKLEMVYFTKKDFMEI